MRNVKSCTRKGFGVLATNGNVGIPLVLTTTRVSEHATVMAGAGRPELAGCARRSVTNRPTGHALATAPTDAISTDATPTNGPSSWDEASAENDKTTVAINPATMPIPPRPISIRLITTFAPECPVFKPDSRPTLTQG